MIGAIIAKILVKKGFKDFSNRNIDSFLAAWSPQAIFHYPGTAQASGTFTGQANIRAWFERMLAQYPGIDFTVKRVCVQNIFDLVGSNYVIAEWDVRLKRSDGRIFENSGTTGMNLRFGKVIEVRDFIFDLDTVNEGWRTASAELGGAEG